MVNHGEFLRAVTRDDALVHHLQNDPAQAQVEPQERTMLEFVRKLNDSPGEMEEGDTAALREAGFTDREILDIVLITGQFNLMNRLALGLGVPPEQNMLLSRERGEKRFREQRRPA